MEERLDQALRFADERLARQVKALRETIIQEQNRMEERLDALEERLDQAFEREETERRSVDQNLRQEMDDARYEAELRTDELRRDLLRRLGTGH